MGRRLGIKVDAICRISQAGLQVGRIACYAVSLGELLDFGCIAADQRGLRPELRSVRQRNPTLLADCQDRSNQVLIRAHAPGDAVHDDSDGSFGHEPSRVSYAEPICRSRRMSAKPCEYLLDCSDIAKLITK